MPQTAASIESPIPFLDANGLGRLDVANTLAFSSHSDFQWSAPAGAGEYDVARGFLAELRRDRSYGLAADFSCRVPAPNETDPQAPPIGESFYYVIRARDGSNVGSWGSAQQDAEMTVCP